MPTTAPARPCRVIDVQPHTRRDLTAGKHHDAVLTLSFDDGEFVRISFQDVPFSMSAPGVMDGIRLRLSDEWVECWSGRFWRRWAKRVSQYRARLCGS